MVELFNNKSFPEKVFSEDITDWVFISFDDIFHKDFLSKLKVLCMKIGCKKLFIKNIEPSGYIFFEDLQVSNMPEGVLKTVFLEQVTEYIGVPMSFVQITEEGIIYGDESPSVFCLYFIKNFNLGILGTKGINAKEEFKNFEIRDIGDFLNMTFIESNSTEEFYKIVKKKWNTI